MTSVLEHGAKEDNVSSRLEAQYITAKAAVLNPLGVGYSNFRQATQTLATGGGTFTYVEGSDSVYFDTLLGSGLAGLVTLLFLYRKCWRYLGAKNKTKDGPNRILRAACLAVFVFGTATIAPMSIFVAPTFFMLVGLGSIVKRELAFSMN
jgi:O-antigen ligase